MCTTWNSVIKPDQISGFMPRNNIDIFSRGIILADLNKRLDHSVIFVCCTSSMYVNRFGSLIPLIVTLTYLKCIFMTVWLTQFSLFNGTITNTSGRFR